MMIWLIIMLILIALCFVKLKIQFFVKIENTKSVVDIHFLFFEFKRKGDFTLKRKEQKDGLNIVSQKRKTMKKEKMKKFWLWFLKTIRYERLSIAEEIGVLDPFVTAMAIPVLATVTSVSLYFFNINFQHFQFQMNPNYNQLCFFFELHAIASFSIFQMMKSIIHQKMIWGTPVKIISQMHNKG